MVKEYVRLSENRRYRAQTRRFVLEGPRLANDASESGLVIEQAFFETRALQKYENLYNLLNNGRVEICAVTAPVAEKLSGTPSPQGVFCVAKMLDKEFTLDKINSNGVYAAFENIQDPGNLGTMLRTAEAFGIDGVILSPGCADLYSPKVIRAGMGAQFRLPFAVAADFCGTLKTLAAEGMPAFAAVADRKAADILQQDFTRGGLVVIGNEGNGLSAECVEACGKRVTIHMRGRAESLNAAAAASVLMWEMTKSRK